MAATAGPSCGEMGLNSQNKNCRISLEYITELLDGKIGLCERQHISSYTKKFEMIIGPKLDRVNRPLDLLQFTQKRETSENKAIGLEFAVTVQQKGNGVRAHSGGFLQTPAHGTLQCAMWPCRLPAKAPCQLIPDHGIPQKRRTMFGGYLFKYYSVKYQTFHPVCEKASQ